MTYGAATLRQLSVFTVTPNGIGGGIWQSSTGITIDANGNGNVYVATGNGDWDDVSKFGHTMLKLNPSNGLALSDRFTPDNHATFDAKDFDLDISGPILIPNTNLLLVTGARNDFLHLLTINHMGHEQSGNGQIVQPLQVRSGHIHGPPVFYNSPTLGRPIYIWSEGDHLKAFHFNGSTLDTRPINARQFRSAPAIPGEIESVSAMTANRELALSGRQSP